MPDGYANTSSTVDAGQGCIAAAVSIPVSGLPSGTRIRAVVVADSTTPESLGGRVLSSEFVFTTLTPCGTPIGDPTVSAPTYVYSADATQIIVTCPVNPHGIDTTVRLQVASDAGFTTIVVDATPFGAGHGCTSVGIGIGVQATALTASTQYWARFIAAQASTGASVTSSSVSFISPGAPTATTKAATAITASGATLNGTDNNHGSASTWYFEYGPNTSYGNRTPATAASHGGVIGGQPCARTITGLQSGKLYHFRLRVKRVDTQQETIGAPLTFSTT